MCPADKNPPKLGACSEPSISSLFKCMAVGIYGHEKTDLRYLYEKEIVKKTCICGRTQNGCYVGHPPCKELRGLCLGQELVKLEI